MNKLDIEKIKVLRLCGRTYVLRTHLNKVLFIYFLAGCIAGSLAIKYF